MTDTPETHSGATTLTEPVLGYYEGQPITAAGLTINNASGGLHDAVSVDPVRLEVGSRVHVVLECVVRPPQLDPVEKDNLRGPLKLVNRLHADSATFVDEAIVKADLDAQRERIEHAKSIEEQRKREEAGEVPLFDADGEPDTVGSVLDDALGLAEDAEDGAARRNALTTELDTMGKDQLLRLAGELNITGRSTFTKTELVDAIVDAEQEGADA